MKDFDYTVPQQFTTAQKNIADAMQFRPDNEAAVIDWLGLGRVVKCPAYEPLDANHGEHLHIYNKVDVGVYNITYASHYQWIMKCGDIIKVFDDSEFRSMFKPVRQQAIVIAFTLKGQNVVDILSKVSELAATLPDNTILIHGFMPRAVLNQKGFTTDIIDCFDDLFTLQLNMYNDGVLRDKMCDVAVSLNADVYVIGEETFGVSEEMSMYRAAGLTIKNIPL